MKTALITGITGQDGSYLAELLLSKGYKVHGLRRRSSQHTSNNIDHLLHDQNLVLHYGDLTDSNSLIKVLENCIPDEVYNLGAQSHVGISFDNPVYTADVDALGTTRLLQALVTCGLTETKFYQASTSELYGKVAETPQSETTPFYPRSPYGIAKQYSYWMVKHYRETYGMFACNGILFNHESPRRGDNFVTRKIAKGVAAIVDQKLQTLCLGNLDAKRDWGHAQEYVEGMWRMLQQDEPEDFVLATGETHSVREFVEWCFEAADMEIDWVDSGSEEAGYWRDELVVAVDPKLYRPAEVDVLCGDASKALAILGWETDVTVKELAFEMTDAELAPLHNKYRKVLNEIRSGQR